MGVLCCGSHINFYYKLYKRHSSENFEVGTIFCTYMYNKVAEHQQLLELSKIINLKFFPNNLCQKNNYWYRKLQWSNKISWFQLY